MLPSYNFDRILYYPFSERIFPLKNKRKLRTLLLLALNFILLFAVYQLFLRAESMIGTYVYLIAAAALTVAYYIINRGFGNPITDPALLPESWSYKEKCDYVEMVKIRHEKAKGLLYWLLPLAVVLLIDFADIFLLDSLRGILS